MHAVQLAKKIAVVLKWRFFDRILAYLRFEPFLRILAYLG